MAAEAGRYDPEAEMIEVSVDLFVASMALEEGSERRHLEHRRKAQAHLTTLVLDAEGREAWPAGFRNPCWTEEVRSYKLQKNIF